MSVIKNLNVLQGVLSAEDYSKLDAGAALHKRHSNIEFKILSANLDGITVRAIQGKHLSKNYADTGTLVKRTKELFSKFLQVPIHVHPVPYNAAIIEVVDPEWLKDKMLKKGVKISDIVTDTGIDRSNISAWINGLRPMSQIVKAMFYFYFTR